MRLSIRNARLGRLIALTMLLAIGLRVAAQSTQAGIETRLLNQPLYLRGSWLGKKLSFDGAGNIVGRCATAAAKDCSESFTLSGVQVNKVDLQPNKLVLTGMRAGVKFQPSLARIVLRDPIQIEIAAPPDADYGTALAKIFAVGSADLTPSMPDLWQPYARRTFLKEVPFEPQAWPEQAPVHAAPPRNPSGKVSAPVLQEQPTPVFPEAAGKMGYFASVLIGTIIGKDGKPVAIHILRPAGLGLDEAAADAVSNYRFTPAMEGGAPVNVQLNIEVNFHP